MDRVLENIVEIYGTYSVDWMGFNLSRKNPLTYHHIIKQCDKGKKTIQNGAPLTKKAHHFLNYIEIKDPSLYDDWNNLFLEINNSGAPPSEIHNEKIKVLRKKSSYLER